VEALDEAGLEALPYASAPLELELPLTVSSGVSFATALPHSGLRVGAAIEFADAAIGRQLFSLDLSPSTFVEQIAPARTFGLRSQVDQLLAAGLIRGGCLENALVCDGDSWLNPPLRFVEEPVRHKILDLLGDLALIGLATSIRMLKRARKIKNSMMLCATCFLFRQRACWCVQIYFVRLAGFLRISRCSAKTWNFVGALISAAHESWWRQPHV
jgi:UDP-3-O-acyl-N-acetylglucosamine deacetylase